MVNPDNLVPILQALVYAAGPSGQEDDVRTICLRELGHLCDQAWVYSWFAMPLMLSAINGNFIWCTIPVPSAY